MNQLPSDLVGQAAAMAEQWAGAAAQAVQPAVQAVTQTASQAAVAPAQAAGQAAGAAAGKAVVQAPVAAGLSTSAMVGIGVAAAALVGLGVYAYTKKPASATGAYMTERDVLRMVLDRNVRAVQAAQANREERARLVGETASNAAAAVYRLSQRNPNDPRLGELRRDAATFAAKAARVYREADDEESAQRYDQLAARYSDATFASFDMRLGHGGRFRRLEHELAARGARDPRALAAWIGRERLGSKKFNELAAAGRRCHAHAR